MAQFRLNQSDLARYLNHIQADYLKWSTVALQSGGSNTEIRDKMVREFNDGVTFEVGSAYVKVITGDKTGHRSVHSFIVNRTTDRKFPLGTILKAASWAAPARNFGRGDIGADIYPNVRWTGC